MTALVGLKSYCLKTNEKDQNPNVSNSASLSEVLRNIQYFIIQHTAIIIVIFPRTPNLNAKIFRNRNAYTIPPFKNDTARGPAVIAEVWYVSLLLRS